MITIGAISSGFFLTSLCILTCFVDGKFWYFVANEMPNLYKTMVLSFIIAIVINFILAFLTTGYSLLTIPVPKTLVYNLFEMFLVSNLFVALYSSVYVITCFSKLLLHAPNFIKKFKSK